MSEAVRFFTPAEVAAMFPRADGRPMSERTLREQARKHRCCAVVGKAMFFTQSDIEALVRVWHGSHSTSEARRTGSPARSAETASHPLYKKILMGAGLALCVAAVGLMTAFVISSVSALWLLSVALLALCVLAALGAIEVMR